MIDGVPSVLIEAKPRGDDLTTHSTQLYRYFSATDARFAILTNGISYRFFSDLQEPNKMDAQPFFEFNLLEIKDAHIAELKRFHKENFNLEDLASVATELKYSRRIRQMMESQLKEPSDDYVRFWMKDAYSGRLTQHVLDQFRPVVKLALNQYINDIINNRLKSAMAADEDTSDAEAEVAAASEAVTEPEDGVETTSEELEAVYVVKSILRKEIDPSRVTYRDRKAWCNVLIDDNIRKWVCRLMLDGTTKRVELNRDHPERITLETIDDLYALEDQLVAVAREVEES